MERFYVTTKGAHAVVSATDNTPKEATAYIVIGNRIPRDYFVTKGRGESNITVHAGSYHLALRSAGIEMCNIITYSSILPACATEVERPAELIHGAVLETIMAVSTADRGDRATAGIAWGWLNDRENATRHGGLVCEYNGSDLPAEAEEQLRMSLDELYDNGYSEQFRLEEITVHMDSFVPKKQYGTSIVSMCFLNHFVPIVES
ncbi:MAG TPA: pyruvoyl-dependent arginine decarboxylase [Spirochaetia bacterium]|nr:pyruvoyl-dependent arginine decarboxylase [Spirochaetia bacterium]